MIKIAIADDSAELLREAERLVKKYMETSPCAVQIKSFTEPLILRAAVTDGECFDIYLLDVEMPGVNGMDLAGEIRRAQPAAVIIFLTAYIEYAAKGYTVRALRYILKPRMAEELPEALAAALEALSGADNACLTLSRYNNITRIFYRDIIYVRKDARCVRIVTTEQGALPDNRGIKELFEALHDARFTFTDRSCFVNLDFARAIDGNWMVMKNGERLPISRPMMPKVKEAIMGLGGG